MVFNWSLSDSKSPQVYRTLLSILAVVWMVSIYPPISNSSSPFTKPSVPFQVRQIQLVSPSPSCSTSFSVLWQGLSASLSFRFLWFPYVGRLNGKVHYTAGFFFKLSLGMVFWLGLGDLLISQNPRELLLWVLLLFRINRSEILKPKIKLHKSDVHIFLEGCSLIARKTGVQS